LLKKKKFKRISRKKFFQESVTFDPFTSLSVPLPKRIAVDTIVTFRNDEKPPTKV
jgi:hypothetical protein